MPRVYKLNRTSTVPVEFHRYLAHKQTVETRPFSPHCLGPGNEVGTWYVPYGTHPLPDL